MSDRYPGYDVAAKRWTPSWNAITRAVIDKRLAVHPGPRFLDGALFLVLEALCGRILPQDEGASAIPLAAFVDEALLLDRRPGYRHVDLPPFREAWLRGLAASDAEAAESYARPFAELDAVSQDHLIGAMQAGKLTNPAWGAMPCQLFFSQCVMSEIPRAFYAHPSAWNEIGFGGPASPRGYVRMDFDQRDPWEAVEAPSGGADATRKANARVGR